MKFETEVFMKKTFHLNNPIDIQIKLNDTGEVPTVKYTIHMPRNSSDKKTLDMSVLVLKIDMKNINTVFVTITDMTDNLLVNS